MFDGKGNIMKVYCKGTMILGSNIEILQRDILTELGKKTPNSKEYKSIIQENENIIEQLRIYIQDIEEQFAILLVKSEQNKLDCE